MAKALSFDFIDLDDYLEQKVNQTISSIFQEKGEPYFRKLESECLAELSELSNVVVALGGGTPCNDSNIGRVKQTGLSFFLNPKVSTIVNRLKTETAHRPLLKDKTEKELENFINEKLNERKEYYCQADYSIEEEDVVDFVLNKI